MPKLYAYCTDPDSLIFRDMIVKLQVWGIDTTSTKDGRGRFFDALLDQTEWRTVRRNAFASLVLNWPKVH